MQRSSLKILSEGMVRLVFPKVNCRSNAYCSGVRSMKSKSACELVHLKKMMTESVNKVWLQSITVAVIFECASSGIFYNVQL